MGKCANENVEVWKCGSVEMKNPGCKVKGEGFKVKALHLSP